MSVTRRQFLCRTLGCGAAAATATALPGCAPSTEPAPIVDVPAPGADGVPGRMKLIVANYPDLAKPGGAIAARASGVNPPVLIARTADGGFSALSSICPHRGCPVGVQDFQAVCPCHDSRFDLSDGHVTNPPAVQGLTHYPTFFDASLGELDVDLLAGDPGFPTWSNGAVVFPFAQFPALQQAGGSAVGHPGGAPRPLVVLVISLPGGAYAAVNGICTHLGCTVGFDPRFPTLIICPCHGSQYTTDGVVTQGPATRSLERFAVTADAQGVTVQVPATAP